MTAEPIQEQFTFLAGGGDMGARMRAKNWASTPLGHPQTWPQSLRTSVSTCLNCAFPILLWWGPELVLLYNDEYAPILGEKHPAALGQPGAVCWAELWDVIGPMLRQVAGGGEPTRSRDLLLVPRRLGFLEECYFSFSYSPIRDETGGIGGIFTPVIETTAKVIGERRLQTLRALAAGNAATLDVPATLARSAASLAQNPRDLPFAALYLIAPDRQSLALAGSAGLPTPCSLFPAGIALNDDSDPSPVRQPARAAAAGTQSVTQALAAALAELPLPANPWPDPPANTIFCPITPTGHDLPSAILIAGLSPRLAEGGAYREFLDLAAGQIGAALADAMAYEEERRRAEALARLDQAKSAFFANVSHEFRTPLTLMLGPLEEILNDSAAGAPLRDKAGAAHRNALRLLRLVNDLLDFSRLEAGRAQANRKPTDIAALTADLASQFRSLCETAGLTLRVDCPPLPALVPLDHAMWEKIVSNLLSNAFKFTHRGGIEVATRLAENGAFAELRVRDTGIGIAADELPRLFDRFHRVAGAAGRTHEGAGIGLALVREMAQLHGGDVRVRSAPGRGSEFTVRISMAPPAAADAADASTADPAAVPPAQSIAATIREAATWTIQGTTTQTPPADPDAPSILVAEDNADMRAYITRLLGTAYRVETVPDGRQALARARETPPDLILSDVMMQHLDGVALVRQLRDDPATAAIPVILLSARAGTEAGAEGLLAGADDYLVKPFAEQELRARVAAVLRAAAARRAITERERSLLASTAEANARLTAALAELEAREAELRRLNADLESEVGERTAERDRIWRISQELLIVVGADGILRAANPAWERILGYTESEVVGRNLSLFMHPEDLARSLTRLEMLHDGPLSPNENRYRHKDGSWRWIAWTAVAERGLFYGVGRDITAERLQAETLAKTEDALRQAQKMEAVGQLTGGIAHDFNNLLQSISSGVELMRRRLAEGRPQEALRFVDSAQKAIDRAAALTYRLLAFSRRQSLSPRSVAVDHLVHGMADLIRQTTGPAIEVRVHMKDGCWAARCDTNQLENAILNLAINARDAMPQGGTFTIETDHATLSEADIAGAPGARPGDYVRITAHDTGLGMTPDVLARAFEPFFTTKPAGQGTGLGLSQVYGFISQSSGIVRLESTPGAGTSVHLLLPRDLDEGTKADDAVAVLAAAPPRAAAAATVLLVDDEPDLRAHSAEALRDIGCRVIEAADGAAALNALRDALRHDGGGIDILVSDIGLPGGLSGRQLADVARDMLPDLPVLLVSGYDGTAGAPTIPPGMAYLEKPFALETLTARVRAMAAI